MNPLQRLVPFEDLLSVPKGMMEQGGHGKVRDQLPSLIPMITTYNPFRSLCSDAGNGIDSAVLLQLGKVGESVIGSGPIPLGGWVLSRYALMHTQSFFIQQPSRILYPNLEVGVTDEGALGTLEVV